MDAQAAERIAALELSPHPEGGYFREIHRSAATVDARDGRLKRSALTTIYFLLNSSEVSCWHRVASDEIWCFIEGAPLELHEADSNFDSVVTRRLGAFDHVTEPVRVIAADSWQAARSTGDYTLVACTVAPGFDFADFEMLRNRPREAEAFRLKHPHLASFV